MKTILSFSFLLAISIFAASQARADKSLKDEFKTLGDNQEVVERVKRLDTHQKVRVVQNRLVDRNHRIELAFDAGTVSGGDSYVQSQSLGGKIQYHINPKWSLGVEYQKGFHQLTQEGKRRYDTAYEAQKMNPNSPERFPDVDFPLSTQLATISFYPIYGKLNLFDSGIAQFDIYTLLGYGKKTLNSGESDVFAAGLGAGIWLNSFLTTRLEVRYEKYKDLLQTDERQQNAITAMASVGLLIW